MKTKGFSFCYSMFFRHFGCFGYIGGSKYIMIFFFIRYHLVGDKSILSPDSYHSYRDDCAQLLKKFKEKLWKK